MTTKLKHEALNFVLMTEKCVRLIESENKLVFIVARSAKKPDIKKAFEESFKLKVDQIRTSIDQKGRKHAYIKMKEPGAAGDLAIRLGII